MGVLGRYLNSNSDLSWQKSHRGIVKMPLSFVHFMPCRFSHLLRPSRVTPSNDASAVRLPARSVASQYLLAVIFCRDVASARSLAKRECAIATRASCCGSRNNALRVKSLCKEIQVGQVGSHSVIGEGICPRGSASDRERCGASLKASTRRSILLTIWSICLSLATALLLFRLVPPIIYTLLLTVEIHNAFD